MTTYKGIQGFNIQNLSEDPVPTVAGWSAGGSMGTARSALAGAGSQTAGLAFGGEAPPLTAATEEWTGAGALTTKTITVS